MTVLGEIRKTMGLVRLLVMMLTSRRSQTYKALALEKDANDYLRKSLDPADLVGRIGRLARAG